MKRLQAMMTEDILASRRSKGDLCWVLKSWNQDAGDFSPKLLPMSLLDCVKSDPGVVTALAQLPAAEQCQARDQIDAVFTEMHHNFSVGSVRRVGYSLAKIFKQLYDRICVERAGIEQVRALPAGIPTLYLPTHRSYVDFLLVSYICFHYGLPLPVIAAGMGECS
ncbi:Dihydroxyacetone phosphate acyltransferase [Amphibalanus amphitrite]|uniref:Dihydroxyacetone phosphate acyltransferase n=1 Tax=Amphibalanus amphitrite TaxID=1232801 RepID=A0A6A4X3R1_AMPAM|nr:Dihydroxyacetone phosphate acyltransferase [Amphibalanus amphitrite]